MERSRCFMMSGSAIMMMIIGIVVIWGGLALSIMNLFRKKGIKKKHLRQNGADIFSLLLNKPHLKVQNMKRVILKKSIRFINRVIVD
ncbi:hypothetical protein COL60_04595 [Bacillus pseudomycoides]|nr:hypothetical protein CON99_02530 [Bacillus pseudomycoides]PFZ12974.1 hypothetical protein COL60_04595 [Bacillus pseudomycoides]